MRPCNQVRQHGANFHGYILPINALYGNVSGTMYICTNVYGYSVPTGKFKALKNGRVVEIKKRHYPLKVWNGFRYIDTTTEKYPQIRAYIMEYMKSPDFIRGEVIQCGFKTRKKAKEHKDILSVCPKIKRHPQAQYGAKSGCYSQSRVDGRGYSIDWEEKSMPLELNSHGMDCLWNECQSTKTERKLSIRPATMNPFEGVTDTDEAKRRDGMKIKQIKCRPGKPYTVE